MINDTIAIYSYNQSNKAESLEQNRSRKGQIERKIEKIDTEQKTIMENIDKLRKDLSTQKVGRVCFIIQTYLYAICRNEMIIANFTPSFFRNMPRGSERSPN